MGYIELKTGQVALRPKKEITPRASVIPNTETGQDLAYGDNKYITIARGDNKDKVAYWNKQL